MENLGPFQVPLSFYGTVALVVLAGLLYLAWRNCCREAAGWIALLLAGQACALELVWAGPHIRLQMFRGWGELLRGPRAFFFAAVLLQTVMVLWGARRYWPGIRRHFARLVSWPQAALVLVLVAYSATTIAPEWAQALAAGDWRAWAARSAVHGSKVALGLLLFVTGLLNLILAAAALPAEKWERAVTWWRSSQRRWLPWAAAGWVVLVSSLLAWVVLERVPHVPDEVCYVFQAKYFAEGRLWVPEPPDKDAFFIPFTISEGGKWYAATAPGWPAVLAVGYFLGAPWLVNPLLGGFAILLANALLRRLYGRGIADGGALLMAASPWLLWMSASLMPHAATLVFALLGLWGTVRARLEGSAMGAAVAGLAFGALLHVRPLEAVIVAVAAGAWWLADWRRIRIAALAAALAAGLGMTALFLLYNHALTGKATETPINKYLDETFYPGVNRLGFGPDVGSMGWTGLDALPGHGPIDVFINTNQALHMLNFDLFGWMCGSLLLAYLLGGWALAKQSGANSADRLMWGVALGTVAGMSLYWYSGVPDFGARYWYVMILPCAALTLRGAQVLASRVLNAGMPPEAPSRVWALVTLAVLVGTATLLTWRSLDKYWHYRGTSAELRELAQQHNFGRSLVVIRGLPWPDYASASPLNPAVLDADAPGPIFARDTGEAGLRRLRAWFPDRAVWVVEGPTQTKKGFRVVAAND